MGNELRGDDGVGLQIAREIDRQMPHHCRVIISSGEGSELIEQINLFPQVYIFDAVYTQEQPPGAIYRFDAVAEPIPVDFFHYSTHKFSLAEAVELARVLEQLPPKLIIYGVEGQQFEFGAPLHPEVCKAIPRVVDMALRDIANDMEKH